MDTQTYSENLISLAKEMKNLAYEYKKSRSDYADALNKLTVLIYKSGLSADKSAFENKIPKLFNTEYGKAATEAFEQLNNSQQTYKGLEIVLKAYQAEISGLQSVIKWHLTGELNTNVTIKKEEDLQWLE